jgi:uncharacterized protein
MTEEKPMRNIAVWFEIPVKDMERARLFYSNILGYDLPVQDLGGVLMAFFPMAGHGNSGALIRGDGYEPCERGTVVYLNAGEDLVESLERIEPSGGKVVVPKTKITDEYGHFALFQDTEGNLVGLHSMK